MSDLDDEHWATLRAALDRIIPADDYPSASANGVDAYLAHQFAGDLAPLAPLYRLALDALAAEALLHHETRFADLDPSAQDDLLHALERGDTRADWETDSQQFMVMLAQHAIEGYYSDAGNGGNVGGASWRMLGFEVTR